MNENDLPMLIVVTICIMLIEIGIVACIMSDDIFKEYWNAGNLFGRTLIVLGSILLIPGFIAVGLFYAIGELGYLFCAIIGAIINAIIDFAFPRKAGWKRKIPYDEALYKMLRQEKVYCEHWDMECPNISVIVFLCKKDYAKARKLHPELPE